MSKHEHLKRLRKGSAAWNVWRRANPKIVPDLSEADLTGEDLSDSDLTDVNLSGANLTDTNLTAAELTDADLRGANLFQSTMSRACLKRANLTGAYLVDAFLGESDFTAANLSGADLTSAFLGSAKLYDADLRNAILAHAILVDADLRRTNLRRARLDWAYLNRADLSAADLRATNLSHAVVGSTIFGNNDLSTVKGLDNLEHTGPSTVGVDTLFRSDGKIPEVFLRGVGFPKDFVTFLPSLLVLRAIEFYSCFISYSHLDEEFSKHLYRRMRSENLRVWYAPEDMKGGRKLHEEVFRAIQIHDKLLLVLSKDSMKSEWVMTEIRRARKVEREENRRKLFRLDL